MGRAILVTLLLASALINHVNGDKVIGGGNGFCAYLMFPEWYYKDTGSTKLQIVGQQRAANPAQCAKLCIAHQMASSYDEGCRTFNFWPDQRKCYMFKNDDKDLSEKSPWNCSPLCPTKGYIACADCVWNKYECV